MNCWLTNSPTTSPLRCSVTTRWSCACAAWAATSPALVPPVPDVSAPPRARSPPIGDAVAVTVRSSTLGVSTPNVFEPGANWFDFHVQYSVAHAGGSPTGSGLPSLADMTKKRWFLIMPALSRSEVWRNSLSPSADHASCVGSPFNLPVSIVDTSAGAESCSAIPITVASIIFHFPGAPSALGLLVNDNPLPFPLYLAQLRQQFRRVGKRREAGADRLRRERRLRKAKVRVGEREVRGNHLRIYDGRGPPRADRIPVRPGRFVRPSEHERDGG